MKVHTILDQIDLGSMALPKFQRSYVWNRDQVKSLMQSLYRKHPVGSLLVWVTKAETAQARGNGVIAPGTVKLLLDGQQRMTSLYGIVRGKEPRFFEGNKQAFTGLYFNLDDESFEFYMPMKMKDSPVWVSVTEVMETGAATMAGKFFEIENLRDRSRIFLERLNRIDSIKEFDLHIEEVTGDDKTVDVVVDIFNRVNTGGTKLSKGDLALAKICAEWPEAREQLNARLSKWRKVGFGFKLDWLLRCINATVTGESLFTSLEDVDTEKFADGLKRTEKSVDTILNLIASRLGLDHDRVLGSRYSFPLLARYLVQRNGKLHDHQERDRLLYWYVHTFLWGRYSGSTESVLAQDLNAIKENDGALERLIQLLRKDRGDLRLNANDFLGWSRGARFYPMLYMLTRVLHARDWLTGVELSNMLLGKFSSLQVHHIFPRALLYKHNHKIGQVNAIANFTFLTAETNEIISNRTPEDYFVEVQAKQPGALESHWIPADPQLWKIDRFADFLAARRELLAQAANKFLDSLLAGSLPETKETTPITERKVVVSGSVDNEEEERQLLDTNIWVVDQGLPEGEFGYELVDAESGELLAILDLAWPDGLQEGLSDPVALLIDETEETHEEANKARFKCFTNALDFMRYVKKEILAQDVADLIQDADDIVEDEKGRPARQKARFAFFTELLQHAKATSDLHGQISPSRYSWIGTRRHGQWWNYVSLQTDTRVELYIDGPNRDENKALFDQLVAHRESIEATFGGVLFWQRLDDKRASRISYTVPGGWADSSTWPVAIEQAVDAMTRLYAALAPRLKAVG